MKTAHFSYKCATLVIVLLLLLMALMIEGPISTPSKYLMLVDRRTWLDIPNAWNVLSNIPFLIVGLWGLSKLSKPGNIQFNDSKEILFYVVFFIAVFLVAFGSSYFHWAPNNYHLMWDRYPIAITMVAFFCAIMAERIDIPFSRFILWPFVIICILGIYYWYFTVTHGKEDVRFYTLFLVFMPLILTPLILLMFKAPYSKSKYIWFAIVTFILARITETYDLAIYNGLNHFISGHAIKHLLLGVSCLFILIYLLTRKSLVYR